MKYCDKCLAEITDDSEFCKECGAPFTASFEAKEGADREVYPEIARANLLRMRGSLLEAERVCLGVLRRYPNNLTATILMGDIVSDVGRNDEALQWYQSAIEMDPEDAHAKARLEDLTARQEAQKPKETRPPHNQIGRRWLYGMFLLIVSLMTLAGYQAVLLIARTPSERAPALERHTLTVPQPTGAIHKIGDSDYEEQLVQTIAAKHKDVAEEIKWLSQDHRHATMWASIGPYQSPTLNTAVARAVQAAKAIFEADMTVSSVTIKVLGWTGTTVEPVLTASIDKRIVGLQIENALLRDVVKDYFSDVWIRPDLVPPDSPTVNPPGQDLPTPNSGHTSPSSDRQ